MIEARIQQRKRERHEQARKVRRRNLRLHGFNMGKTRSQGKRLAPDKLMTHPPQVKHVQPKRGLLVRAAQFFKRIASYATN